MRHLLVLEEGTVTLYGEDGSVPFQCPTPDWFCKKVLEPVVLAETENPELVNEKTCEEAVRSWIRRLW